MAHQSRHSQRQVQAVLSAAARDWLGVGHVRQEMAQRRAAAQTWTCRSGRQLQTLAAKDSASTRVVATGDLGLRCSWVQHSFFMNRHAGSSSSGCHQAHAACLQQQSLQLAAANWQSKLPKQS